MEKGNMSGRSQIFSGGASKKGLKDKLSSAFYGERDMSYPGGMPGGANKTYDGPEKNLKSPHKDYDGDGKQESSEKEYLGSVDKAIKAKQK
jgi:hypothetical protein|tara:strand:- start:359 stop:631 length:273 start_codon:yes stop_codon:yes gene_type:complete